MTQSKRLNKSSRNCFRDCGTFILQKETKNWKNEPQRCKVQTSQVKISSDRSRRLTLFNVLITAAATAKPKLRLPSDKSFEQLGHHCFVLIQNLTSKQTQSEQRWARIRAKKILKFSFADELVDALDFISITWIWALTRGEGSEKGGLGNIWSQALWCPRDYR